MTTLTIESEEEITNLLERLDRISTAFGMQINVERAKLVTNNVNVIGTDRDRRYESRCSPHIQVLRRNRDG